MLPYFSPAEWVYFADEEIPYKHEPLPAFNPKEFSLFIKKHKIDYMDIAEKLGLTEANAKNIFLHRRANLSLLHIRKLAAEVNPEEFFVPADESVDGFFYPDRGDIVSLSGKTSWFCRRIRIIPRMPVLLVQFWSQNPTELFMSKVIL